MSKTVEFIFDFASPNAYLAYRALPEVLERTSAKLQITPCLLGGIFKATGNQPPMMAFGSVKGKLAYEQLEIKRFIQNHGLVKFKFNSHFPVNSLMMMRGLIAAQSIGKQAEFIEAGLTAMWESDLKMDDPEIFMQTFADAGFDPEWLSAQIQADDVKATLMQNTANAVDRGCFGVPTFFVKTEMFFGKERLAQIEQALLA